MGDKMSIKDRRKAAGYRSMQAACDATHITLSTLYRFETGRKTFESFSEEKREMITKVLKCAESNLVSKKETTKKTSVNNRCKITRMNPAKLEKLLEEKYGKPLPPINKKAKPPLRYFLDDMTCF